MTSNQEVFSSLDNVIKYEIKLCDEHLVDSLGKWIDTIVTKQNEIKGIPNVHFFQGFKHNLLSNS